MAEGSGIYPPNATDEVILVNFHNLFFAKNSDSFSICSMSLSTLLSSVADPGCLYRIPDPNFSIPDLRLKRSRILMRFKGI